jgi:hypothetical protein
MNSPKGGNHVHGFLAACLTILHEENKNKHLNHEKSTPTDIHHPLYDACEKDALLSDFDKSHLIPVSPGIDYPSLAPSAIASSRANRVSSTVNPIGAEIAPNGVGFSRSAPL